MDRINLPIGGASLATMVFLFPNLHGQEDNGVTFAQKIRELDLVSNCLFIPSLTTLFLALSWGGVKYAWSDGRLIGLLATFAILLATFLVNQYRRGDSAALPFRIITTRSVISGFIFTACTNSVTNVLEWYLPTFYQVAQGRVSRSKARLRWEANTYADAARERLSYDPNPCWDDGRTDLARHWNNKDRLLRAFHAVRFIVHAYCYRAHDDLRP